MRKYFYSLIVILLLVSCSNKEEFRNTETESSKVEIVETSDVSNEKIQNKTINLS